MVSLGFSKLGAFFRNNKKSKVFGTNHSMEEDYGNYNSDDEYYNDDDYNDVEQGFDDGESKSFGSSGETSSCKVIRKESLLAAQKDDLQRVMDFLSLKEHHARTLLIHYRWDVDKVFAVFVEKGKERLYGEAGVLGVDSNNLSSFNSFTELTCQICFEDLPSDKITTMECGHFFCNECWTGHFIVKINEGQSRRITCMAHKCHAICDEDKVRSLVSAKDPKLTEKFDRFLLESYIEDNKSVKWCPSIPHCGNAIRVEKDQYCEVECACGLQFCFSCSKETHSPCSCFMWERWLTKCQDDSETVNWIKVNTKNCPKCHKAVEKNGGCNLVYCVCKQAFCWLCGGATGSAHTWTTIEGHECGRFKEEHIQNTERAKKALMRYSHYFNRYKAHTDSLKTEEKNLKEQLQQKVSTLESRVLENKDYRWVPDGLRRLTTSRKILLYSYPFAYFMFDGDLFKDEMSSTENTIKLNLFENQQQQLESNIEKLSMSLEESFEVYPENEVTEFRNKVIILSTITENLCKQLYDCIENELIGGLSSLQQATHVIAPYKSKGVERASELLDDFSVKTGTTMGRW